LAIRFACLGDSITSDQVTGIGTLVAQKLNAQLVGNFATGYATCSDWHDGDRNMTTVTLEVPPNTNTDDNVLSNQVRRLLQAVTPDGSAVQWCHPVGGTFGIDGATGCGLPVPDIIYIAISTNDGNQPYNAVLDDLDRVCAAAYADLTRNSLCSALRWAIETLQCVCPQASIYVATPLQTCCEQEWMSFENTLQKRNMIVQIAELCGVRIIDSFYDSGFTEEVARDHGEIHPDPEWKERIADFVAERIRAAENMS